MKMQIEQEKDVRNGKLTLALDVAAPRLLDKHHLDCQDLAKALLQRLEDGVTEKHLNSLGGKHNNKPWFCQFATLYREP